VGFRGSIEFVQCIHHACAPVAMVDVDHSDSHSRRKSERVHPFKLVRDLVEKSKADGDFKTTHLQLATMMSGTDVCVHWAREAAEALGIQLDPSWTKLAATGFGSKNF